LKAGVHNMMKRKKVTRYSMAFMLSTSMMLTGAAGVFAAENTQNFQDIQQHWAKNQIQQWIDQGLAHGYKDGTFKPDHTITRAEFVTLVNQAFGFTTKTTNFFSDVHDNDWFMDEVSIAKANGYITGYKDGTFRPNSPISREEVAAILSHLLNLNTSNSTSLDFKDSGLIQWSKSFVSAVVENGAMNGYPDHTFQPARYITRAEAIVALDHAKNSKGTEAAGLTLDKAGTYGPSSGTETVNGSVVIQSAGVVLQNKVINGDLTITDQVGDGDVILKNVVVKGTTTIKGGGMNSIHLEDSTLNSVIVNKADGHVRLVANGSTQVGSVTLQSGAKLEEDQLSGDGFEDVSVDSTVPAQADVILNGSFQKVEVQGATSTVELTSGNVQDLVVKANSTLNLAEGTKITNLAAQSAVQVTGTGSIESATVSSQGTTFEQKPANLQVGDNLTTTVAGAEVTGNTAATGAGGGGGGAAPVTSIALTPTASNITLGGVPATGTGSNLTINLPGDTALASLQANVNAASKIEIVGLLNGSGVPKLDRLKEELPDATYSTTVAAGNQSINLASMIGLPATTSASMASLAINKELSSSFTIQIRLTNSADSTQSTTYNLLINVNTPVAN
jgi:hypothetical protein